MNAEQREIERILRRVEHLRSDGTLSAIREANALCISNFRTAAYLAIEEDTPKPRRTISDHYPAGAIEEMP